jgi:hypothetical protein
MKSSLSHIIGVASLTLAAQYTQASDHLVSPEPITLSHTEIKTLCTATNQKSGIIMNKIELCEVSLDGGKTWENILGVSLASLLLVGSAAVYMRRRGKTKNRLSTDTDWVIDNVMWVENDTILDSTETNKSDTHEMSDTDMILVWAIPQNIREIPVLNNIIPAKTINSDSNTLDVSITTDNIIEELQKNAKSHLQSLMEDLTKSKDTILKELAGKLELQNLSDPVASFYALAAIPQTEFGDISATFYQKLLIVESNIQSIQQQIEVASVKHQADLNNAPIEKASQESFQNCIDRMKILSQEIIEDRSMFLLWIQNEAKKMEVAPIVPIINNKSLSDSIDFDLIGMDIEDHGETNQWWNEWITEPTIDNTSWREVLSQELIQSIQEKTNARIQAENELNVRAIRLDKRTVNTPKSKNQRKWFILTPKELRQKKENEFIEINKKIVSIFNSMELFQANAGDIIYREDIEEYSEEYHGKIFGQKQYTIAAYQHKNDLNATFSLKIPNRDPIQFFKPSEFLEYMIQIVKSKYDTILQNIQNNEGK